MLTCRLCNGPTTPVPFTLPEGCPAFVRCIVCGSDSSPLSYSDVRHLYSTANAIRHRESGGGHEAMRKHCSFNTDWLLIDRNPIRRTFLDVGSCDGSALDNMVAGGWTAQGFDVVEPDDARHPVKVAESFSASLFPSPFGAVLCREVIEHVPNPMEFLRELASAVEVGGLLQVQTPRTCDSWNPIGYQTAHLQIFSTGKLISMLQDAGLRIIDKRIWPEGQAWLCRR
jgi:hypothetical protein